MKTEIIKWTFRLLPALALLAAASIALAADAGGPGYAYGGTAGKSGNCLDCHGNAQGIGDRYFIDPVKYGHTSHARIGCPACHDTVGRGHPGDQLVPARTGCLECHGDTAAEYARTPHAANASCGDCHDPHRVNAPNEISGQEMNRMCASCHKKESMAAKHARWLPQADLHLDMLPCTTCHTGSKNYVINLYIIKREGDRRNGVFRVADFAELEKIAGGKDIRSIIDRNGDNYISLAELGLFNRNPAYGHLRLQGVLTPETVTHNFEILQNRWDCTFCHASGPGAMQTSFIALPEKSGAFRRVAVEKGAVLDTLNGPPDFYLTGASRNGTLNNIGLAIIAGGMVMPVGHGFLRFLTRKNRKGKEHQS